MAASVCWICNVFNKSVYIQQRKWLGKDENADLKSFIPKERRYLSHTGLERHWISCANLSMTI